MLSPEIWNFKTPVHNYSVYNGSRSTFSKTLNEIGDHHFTHCVTIVIPDTVLVPEDLNLALTNDSVYYKVSNLPINRFLDKQFIDSFVKSGQLSALSVGTHIDTDDCATITPSGHLVLNLLKETYQSLGLEGTQSKFSSERYVVQINLKKDSFVPDKKNYEHTVKCLTEFVNLQMDFLVAWEPPETSKEGQLICPSSVAAYLSNLGFEVSSCVPQTSSTRQYSVRLPVTGTDHHELLEWMGAVAMGVNMSHESAESRYLSSYQGPLENIGESQIAVLKYYGFFTSTQMTKLLKIFSGYVEKRKDLPWAGIHVQGFSDSPVSWGLREHTYYSDGDNHFTILLQPDGSYLLFKLTSAPTKMKLKLS